MAGNGRKALRQLSGLPRQTLRKAFQLIFLLFHSNKNFYKVSSNEIVLLPPFDVLNKRLCSVWGMFGVLWLLIWKLLMLITRLSLCILWRNLETLCTSCNMVLLSINMSLFLNDLKTKILNLNLKFCHKINYKNYILLTTLFKVELLLL